jgi:uncharacterized protein YutE (UPF0331/DUF86 family)
VLKSGKEAPYNRVLGIRELEKLGLINSEILVELEEFRKLRNQVAHAHGGKTDYAMVNKQKIDRLNEILDEIEKEL